VRYLLYITLALVNGKTPVFMPWGTPVFKLELSEFKAVKIGVKGSIGLRKGRISPLIKTLPPGIYRYCKK